MPGSAPLSRETFLDLAQQAGLDTSDPHMDELYEYVQNALTGLQSLDNLDVNGMEPDMAFIPARE